MKNDKKKSRKYADLSNQQGYNRRYFLKGAIAACISGGALAAGIKSFFETPLEVRVLDVIKSTGSLREGEYHIYQNSRTIELFIPDAHAEEVWTLQKNKVTQLIQALAANNAPVQAIGLEGLPHGFLDKFLLRRLLKEQQDRTDPYWTNKRSSTAQTTIDAYQDFLKNSNVSADELRQQQSALTVFDSINDVYFFSKERIDGCRKCAPGLAYMDMHSKIFGLEQKELDDREMKRTQYIIVNAAIPVLTKVEQNAKLFGPQRETLEIYDLARELRGHLDKEKIVLEAKLSRSDVEEIQKIRPGEIDFANLMGYLNRYLSRDECKDIYERTEAWVGSSPSEIKGAVLVIGGAAHMSPYKRAAEKKKQSFAIVY